MEVNHKKNCHFVKEEVWIVPKKELKRSWVYEALLLGTLKGPTPSTQQAFPIVQNSLTKTFHAKISYI